MYTYILVFSLFCTPLFAKEKNALLFAGSTRADSYNKKLINESARILESFGVKTTVLDLRDYQIPFYNGDLEAASGMPDMAKKLKSQMIQADIIAIATPEYNGSISAVLKNVLDWTSRQEKGGSSREAYQGKTFVLLSTSPGAGGGKRALANLKAIIEAISKEEQLQLYSLPHASSAFTTDGRLKDEQLLKQLLNQTSQKETTRC